MFAKYIVLHTHTEFGMSTVRQFKEMAIQAIDLLKLDGNLSTVISSSISIVNYSPNVSTVNSKVSLFFAPFHSPGHGPSLSLLYFRPKY